MIYGIASYHRPECRTIKTLLDAGVPFEDIVVSVQDENDLQEYKKKHPDIRIIFRKTDCAAGNRNTLLNNITERPLCLLDDDISSFCIFTQDGRFLVNTPEALKQLEQLAKTAQVNNSPIAGVSAVANGIIARNRPDYTIDALLQGTVIIMLSKNLRFDERFKMVEDYEISLKTIYSGFHTIRYNYLAANKPKNGTNKGGLHDRYAKGELPLWLERLHKKYPLFKVNKAKTGGDIKWK